MIIKALNINIDKSKRLWLLIIVALTVALMLIIFSFVFIGSSSQKNILKSSENPFLNLNTYYAEYKMDVFSNKNKNNYYMKEWYLKKENNESFRFDFEDNNKNKVSYILSNNKLILESNAQISNFDLESYNISKKNLISISIFLELYNKILTEEKNKGKIEIKNVDSKMHYIINLKDLDEELKQEYNDNQMMVYKMELIVDSNTCLPIEYYLYDENENIMFGITYEKFDISSKLDEKIFQK